MQIPSRKCPTRWRTQGVVISAEPMKSTAYSQSTSMRPVWFAAVYGDSCRLSFCESGLPPTITCEGCHITDYCSKDCQELHFRLHANTDLPHLKDCSRGLAERTCERAERDAADSEEEIAAAVYVLSHPLPPGSTSFRPHQCCTFEEVNLT